MAVDQLEKLIYESRPVLYVAAGFTALQSSFMHQMGRIPATALIICGLMVLFWRFSHRGYIGAKSRSKD